CENSHTNADPPGGPSSQVVLQSPQWVASVLVSTSQPSVTFWLQLANGALHSIPHTPFSQVGLALGACGQATPHAPQFAGSVLVFTPSHAAEPPLPALPLEPPLPELPPLPEPPSVAPLPAFPLGSKESPEHAAPASAAHATTTIAAPIRRMRIGYTGGESRSLLRKAERRYRWWRWKSARQRRESARQRRQFRQLD